MTRILVILIALAIMQTVCEGAQEGTAGSGQRGIRFAPGPDGVSDRQEGPVRSGGQAQKEADAEGPAGPGQPEREQQGGPGVPRRQGGSGGPGGQRGE